MKLYSISDNGDTATGLRLVGIPGAVVNEGEQLKKELDKVIADKDIAVLIITEKLSKIFPDYINDIKLNRTLPLVVEIPDRHGTGRPPNFITKYINEAIGVKLT